jgi:diaminopimelate decarboxylase
MDSAFHFREGHLFCEEVPVERIAVEHGTPLYVYSRRAMLRRLDEFTAAFAPVNPLIAYSVKANANLSILRLLRDHGAGADIVSAGELFRALRAGIPAERIVFSGVGKTVPEMEAGAEAGILGFNVESESELHKLSRVATSSRREIPVALRINPDIESPTPHAYTRTGHLATKFGIPAEEALRVYRVADRLPGIRPRGIDVHIGSQILDPAPYEEAVRQILGLVTDLRRENIELEYIDLGGGFGVAYQDEPEKPASAFAQAIVPRMLDSGLRLILEPGRYILAPAGILVARVLHVKSMGPKTFIVTDAGMNDLLRPSHYASYHEVTPVTLHPARRVLPFDVVGPVCEAGDFLALDRHLERPEEDELLAVHTVGAYGFSMASNYNQRLRPAEVLVEETDFRLIRRRESYADLLDDEEELLR